MKNALQRCAVRVAFIVPFAAFLGSPFPGWASTITLGSAQSFAVLGASTVTNTGDTTITGDLGLWPGTSFTPGSGIFTLNGALHIADGVAQQAQSDALTAYNNLASQAVDQNLSGTDLGGLTLTPGVYSFNTSAELTGKLTLNFKGDPNALFVFLIGKTLTTASSSSVVFENSGGLPVGSAYWDVGSSATLGTTTAFAGNIIAVQSITLTTGATIECGRAIALNAAVTMDTNTVDIGNCESTTEAAPEPATVTLLCGGLLALISHGRQSQIGRASCRER